MMLNDLPIGLKHPNLSGFSHFWLAFSPLPCVLALSSAFLIAVAHEVFTQLFDYIGSLLGGCWFLVDGHHNSCKKNDHQYMQVRGC